MSARIPTGKLTDRTGSVAVDVDRLRKVLRGAQVKSPFDEVVDRCVEVELVLPWHPHRLRHSAATELRREFGVEMAQVTLGHKNVDITEVYAEKNLDAVARAISKVG